MRLILILLLMFSYISYSQLQINEICSDNEELFQASNGEFYDWIEIYNNSENNILLSNYYLSDDEKELDKWKFAHKVLQSNRYILVFASDLDEPVAGEQHSNFKLSSKGETLYLSDGTNIIDRVEFGIINEDYTYGRLEESSEIHTNLAMPTPGESNRNSGTIIADNESGYYASGFVLNLIAAAGQKIYYTTNGDDPTTESLEYKSEIEIKDEYEDYEYLNIPTTGPDSTNCRVKWYVPKEEIPRCKVISYCTIDNDGKRSKVYRNSFFFHSNHNLPVVSIITDNYNLFSQDSGLFVPGVNWDVDVPCWTGNYFQKGWEKPATISYFENGKTTFHEDTGIQLHGETTRTAPQKSLRFYARKKYGINKFKNIFFDDAPVEEFNSLVIRSTMSCMNRTLIKDALTLSCIQNLDHEKTYVKPIVVYINGNYWGISELRTRLDENYLAEKYDLNKDSINIVSVDNRDAPRNGNYDEFSEIYHFVKDNDISIEENYEFVKNHLDIDNFIDYYIAEMYFANFDWPGSNYLIWNGKGTQKKYKNLFFDIDAGWQTSDMNMFEHTNQLESEKWPNPRSKNIFQQNLFSNDEFRNKFINRAIVLMENDFNYDRVKSKIDSFITTYGSEIDNNIQRFGFPESKEVWLDNIEKYLTDFASERECHFRKQMKEFFDLSNEILCAGTDVTNTKVTTPTIAPNPANSLITVDNISSDYVIIYDIHGAELMKINSKHKSSLKVDISNLAPSIYFIKMNNSVVKFVKLR